MMEARLDTGLPPTDRGDPHGGDGGRASHGESPVRTHRTPGGAEGAGARVPLPRTQPMPPHGDEAVLSEEGPMRRFHLVSNPSLVVGMVLALHLLAGPGVAGQAVNPHAGEPIGTVQEAYDGALLPDLQVQTFRNTDRLFPTRTVRRGRSVYPLPPAPHRCRTSSSPPGAPATTSTIMWR